MNKATINTVFKSVRSFFQSIPLRQTIRIRIAVFTAFAVILIAVWLWIHQLFFAIWELNVPPDRAIVQIRSGMILSQIADSLYQHGILADRDRFCTAARLSGMSRKLKAGTYQFQGRQNNYRILNRLVQGDILLVKMTFREGIRAKEMASMLEKRLGIHAEAFMKAVHDPGLCKVYEIKGESLEGYLYPDTYYLHPGIGAEETIDLMARHFHEMIPDSLPDRAESMDMTLHDIVTLASIIEGEAVLASERRVISALYHNRLQRGMRLQADPTIQYIIPDGPRRLLSRDLEIDSPYNTYQYGGLPPGPVNNPGIDCIRAALYPADVPYLYMVANGDGSHTFSTNISDHLRAKSRFDRIRRNVRRKNGR